MRISGGRVITETDFVNSSLTNAVLEDHIFGGFITQRFLESDGQVWTQVTGSGFGNFAAINEAVGPAIFTYMVRNQIHYINTQRVMATPEQPSPPP